MSRKTESNKTCQKNFWCWFNQGCK